MISEEFVKELEKSYEKEFDRKTELDTKATSMITISAIQLFSWVLVQLS